MLCHLPALLPSVLRAVSWHRALRQPRLHREALEVEMSQVLLNRDRAGQAGSMMVSTHRSPYMAEQ